jgi:hypothetical protein
MTTTTMTEDRLEGILRNQKRLRVRFIATAVLFSAGFSALVTAFLQST